MVGTDAAAKVRRRPPQQEPLLLLLLRLLLLDRLAQVGRREVATSGNLRRGSAAAAGRVAAVRRRPAGSRFACGSRRVIRSRSQSHAPIRPQTPVAGAVRLHLRVPIRAVSDIRSCTYIQHKRINSRISQRGSYTCIN